MFLSRVKNNLEMLATVFCLSIFFFFPRIELTDIWHLQWYLGSAVALVALSYMVARKTHIAAGAAWLYFGLADLSAWAYPQWFGQSYDRAALNFLKHNVSPFFYQEMRGIIIERSIAKASILWLILSLGVIAVPRLNFQSIVKGIGICGVLAALFQIIHGIFTGYTNSIVGNGAMDACFLAAMLPISLHFYYGIFPSKRAEFFTKLLLISIAILIAGSSTAIAAFFVAIAAYAGLTLDRKLFLKIAIATLAIITVSAFLYSDRFLNDNGRFRIWQLIFDYIGNKDYLFGEGSGSFEMLGTALQVPEYFKGHYEVFYFAHNEYLQILFQNGYVGLNVFLAFGLFTLWRTLDRPYLFASLLTYSAIMVLQFPFRYFAPAFFGVVLIREAYNSQRKT